MTLNFPSLDSVFSVLFSMAHVSLRSVLFRRTSDGVHFARGQAAEVALRGRIGKVGQVFFGTPLTE